jgi:hypothetical protein
VNLLHACAAPVAVAIFAEFRVAVSGASSAPSAGGRPRSAHLADLEASSPARGEAGQNRSSPAHQPNVFRLSLASLRPFDAFIIFAIANACASEPSHTRLGALSMRSATLCPWFIVAMDSRVSRAFRSRHAVRTEAKYECGYTAT